MPPDRNIIPIFIKICNLVCNCEKYLYNNIDREKFGGLRKGVAAVKRLTLLKHSDITLSQAAVEKLLDCRDEAALRMYLYLARTGGELEEKSAAARLNIGLDAVGAALDRLRQFGLLQPEEQNLPSDELPAYTATDVKTRVKQDDAFRYLLQFAQDKIGRVLTSADMRALLGIYTWMGLPVEVICLIITCSAEETAQKYGEGRRPTMHAIENRARAWMNLGIRTTAQAEEYLKEQQRRGTRMAALARMLHISGRALSPTEERYLSAWITDGLDDALILEAYDRTVVKTGGLKWKYMDSILKSWQASGYRTVDAVRRGEARTPQKQPKKQAETSSEELDSMRRLRELNREWGSENK